jgi:hypothetical protein
VTPHPNPLPEGRGRCGSSRRANVRAVRGGPLPWCAMQCGAMRSASVALLSLSFGRKRSVPLSHHRGERGGARFKSSPLRLPRGIAAVLEVDRGFSRLTSGRQRLYPTLRREPWLLRPFSLGYFSFTPGILPSALRAGFAVRTHSCACVGQQKKSDSSAGRRSKRPLRKRQAGDQHRNRRLRTWMTSHSAVEKHLRPSPG